MVGGCIVLLPGLIINHPQSQFRMLVDPIRPPLHPEFFQPHRKTAYFLRPARQQPFLPEGDLRGKYAPALFHQLSLLLGETPEPLAARLPLQIQVQPQLPRLFPWGKLCVPACLHVLKNLLGFPALPHGRVVSKRSQDLVHPGSKSPCIEPRCRLFPRLPAEPPRKVKTQRAGQIGRKVGHPHEIGAPVGRRLRNPQLVTLKSFAGVSRLLRFRFHGQLLHPGRQLLFRHPKQQAGGSQRLAGLAVLRRQHHQAALPSPRLHPVQQTKVAGIQKFPVRQTQLPLGRFGQHRIQRGTPWQQPFIHPGQNQDLRILARRIQPSLNFHRPSRLLLRPGTPQRSQQFHPAGQPQLPPCARLRLRQRLVDRLGRLHLPAVLVELPVTQNGQQQRPQLLGPIRSPQRLLEQGHPAQNRHHGFHLALRRHPQGRIQARFHVQIARFRPVSQPPAHRPGKLYLCQNPTQEIRMMEKDIQRPKGAFPAELRQIPQQLPERLLRQRPTRRQVSLPACLRDFSSQIPAQGGIVRHHRRLGGIFLGKKFRQMLHRRLGQIRPVATQLRLHARQHLLFSPEIRLR